MASNVATDAASHADGATVTLIEGNSSSDNDYFGWGEAASGGLTTTTQIRLWSHDNFGEDLLINARDSNIFYWDRTNQPVYPRYRTFNTDRHQAQCADYSQAGAGL